MNLSTFSVALPHMTPHGSQHVSPVGGTLWSDSTPTNGARDICGLTLVNKWPVLTLVLLTGFEPVISCVKGRRVDRLLHSSVLCCPTTSRTWITGTKIRCNNHYTMGQIHLLLTFDNRSSIASLMVSPEPTFSIFSSFSENHFICDPEP